LLGIVTLGQSVYLPKIGCMGDGYSQSLVGTPSTKKVDSYYQIPNKKSIANFYQICSKLRYE